MTDDIQTRLIEAEALNGVPQFLDIPDELVEKIEKLVLANERMFWLRANNINSDDVATRTIVRRALYAEQRLNEVEFMLGEMAMITEGAKIRIDELQQQLSDLVKKT